MAAAVIMAVILVVVIPVGVLMTMPLIAAAMGEALTRDGAARNEGSELVELNR
jgi:hypothetical protein